MSLPDIAPAPQRITAGALIPCRRGRHRLQASFRWVHPFAPSGDWDSCNPAFAISRGSPGTSSHTPGHDHRFPGMLLSLSPFRAPVSHWIQRYLLSSLPAKRAIQYCTLRRSNTTDLRVWTRDLGFRGVSWADGCWFAGVLIMGLLVGVGC